MKAVYPCKLIPEKSGYSVIFPDFAGATQGDNLYEAIFMAEDFANFAVSSAEDDGETIPEPTDFSKMETENGELIHLVRVDTDAYRKSL